MDTVDVYQAVLPFSVYTTGPEYCPSTDAIIGSVSWISSDQWSDPCAAEREATRLDEISGGEDRHSVIDALGREVLWPIFGCDLPPDWWTGGKERAQGRPDDYVGF